MPIEIACVCGKRFRIADHLAGRSGTCPSCGAGFSVPVPKTLRKPDARGAGSGEPMGLSSLDGGDEVEIRSLPEGHGKKKGRTCSGCGAGIAERALVCTSCGRSTLTGKIIQTDTGADDPKPTFFLFRPFFEVGELRVSPALLLVLLLLVGVPIAWYVNGPGRKLAVRSASAVWVLPAMTTGATRDQFSLLTGQGDMSLGAEGSLSGIVGSQADDGDALHYSVGGQDGLLVLREDAWAADKQDGAVEGERGVLLEVGLRQSVLRAAGSTSGYDTVIKASDFELVPLEGQHGGRALPAELLSASFFQSEATLDLGSAKTSNVKKALPAAEPTRFSEEAEGASVSALAVYDGVTVPTRGTVRLSASRGYEGYPASDGVFATGTLETTHPSLANDGFEIEHRYTGGAVVVDWDDGDQGRWSKDRMSKYSKMSPWHRYEFGLLFRPSRGASGALSGAYAVHFAGHEVATVRIDEVPEAGVSVAGGGAGGVGGAGSGSGASLASRGKPSPVSPIRTQQGVPSHRTINPNNPLSYFDILLESRDRARGLVSASNLRQIGLGLQTYIQANGDFPESFEQLEQHMPGLSRLMLNPRTGENPGFVYEKPEAGADPSTTAVVWELYGGAKDPNGAVLYGDGSIR